MKVIQTRQRRWQRLSDTEKIRYLLEDKLSAHPFYVKNTVPPVLMNFVDYSEGIFIFTGLFDSENLPQKITLYTTVNKQVEIDFTVRVCEGGRLEVVADQLRIGMDTRSVRRLPVNEDVVVADNFQIGKRIDPNLIRKTALAYQILFNEIEEGMHAKYQNFHVLDLHSADQPDAMRILKKQKGYILVEDTLNPESYKSSSEGEFDYHAHLKGEGSLNETMGRLAEGGIRSFMLYPVLTEDGAASPIAYLYAHSPEPNAGMEPEDFASAAQRLIKRIEDVNFMKIRGRQRVINVSEKGVALEINHPELLKHLPGREWITFDLIFKKQSPIRFRGSFCHIEEFEGIYVAGISFEGTGHSDHIRTSVERFKSLLRLASSGPKK